MPGPVDIIRSGLLMAGTRHGTAAAVASAGGFPLLFIFPHPDHDPGYQRNQRDTDDDRSGIFIDPLKHLLTPSLSVWWLPDTS